MGLKETAIKAVELALASSNYTNTRHLRHLTLREAVEYAMRPLDVSGAHPTEEQYVNFSRIWKAVCNHPELTTPRGQGTGNRRNKDIVRRIIKANQCIRREGATKGSRYFYDSSVELQKLELLFPIVTGEIMRTPISYNDKITMEDICQRLRYTRPSNIDEVLENLSKNAAIDHNIGYGPGVTGYEKIKLNPAIWKFHPFGKGTYNFTLSDPSTEIFADILLNLRHPDNQSKWADMFGAIPLPEGKISKSLIVEIALWNLYHSLAHPLSTEVTAPDILRDSEFQTISVATIMEEGIDKARSEGEPLSETDQSRGTDQSALEALADDEDFKDLVTKLTLTYLKEKKD